MAGNLTVKRREAGETARRGRPPKDRAGEVEERILVAAHAVFIERGFEGASVDEIASVARAGKPTIYARFGSKEALFTEVVLRWLRRNTDIAAPAGGATTEQRLQLIATTILRRALVPESIDLVRSVLAEAKRFPELSLNISRLTRAQGTAAFTRLIGELTENDDIHDLPAFAPERLATTAKVFIELVLLPMLLRALYGEAFQALDAEIDTHALRAVRVFLTACGKSAAWLEQ
jgi:AcrR family transcriptional regulator